MMLPYSLSFSGSGKRSSLPPSKELSSMKGWSSMGDEWRGEEDGIEVESVPSSSSSIGSWGKISPSWGESIWACEVKEWWKEKKEFLFKVEEKSLTSWRWEISMTRFKNLYCAFISLQFSPKLQILICMRSPRDQKLQDSGNTIVCNLLSLCFLSTYFFLTLGSSKTSLPHPTSLLDCYSDFRFPQIQPSDLWRLPVFSKLSASCLWSLLNPNLFPDSWPRPRFWKVSVGFHRFPNRNRREKDGRKSQCYPPRQERKGRRTGERKGECFGWRLTSIQSALGR